MREVILIYRVNNTRKGLLMSTEAKNKKEVFLDLLLNTANGQVTVRGKVIVDTEGIDNAPEGLLNCEDFLHLEGLTLLLEGQPLANVGKNHTVFVHNTIGNISIGNVAEVVRRTAFALAGVEGFGICEESHLGFFTDDLVDCEGRTVYREFCMQFTPFEGGDTTYHLLSKSTIVSYRDGYGTQQYRLPRWYARDYLRRCPSCGCRVLPENYLPELGAEICRFCLQDAEEDADRELTRIHGYTESHGKRPILFDSKRKADALGHFQGEAEDFVGLGFELEVDTVDEPESDNQEVADGLADAVGLEKDAVRFAHDGSLNYGFECISQPHTVEAFWEKAPQWQEMLKYLSVAGYSSHDVGTCGLHVHVSRGMFGKTEEEQDSAIAKVFVFFDENWEDLAKVSRRRNFSYCEKNRLRWEDCEASYGKKYGKYYAWKKSAKSGNARGHYVALNNANSATFEYRLGRGTLNSWSFFSWIDLCLTLTANAKRITVNKVTSNDLVSWLGGIKESTARYLYKRGAFRKAVVALYPSITWEGDMTDC